MVQRNHWNIRDGRLMGSFPVLQASQTQSRLGGCFMNTFRRYLLSFLSMMILPVVIFILIISQIVISYCRNQLIESELVNLNQTRASIEMLTDQMSSYVSLSSQQTAFTARKLSTFGNVFSLRHYIAQWVSVSPAVSDIAFYNSTTDLIYTFDATYTPADYLLWREDIPGMDVTTFRQMLTSDVRRCWLTAWDSVYEKNTILYLNSVRISSSECIWLIFHFKPDVLSALIAEAERPEQFCVLVYAENGQLLYTVGEHPEEMICDTCLSSPTSVGRYGDMQYARVKTKNGLILMSMLPVAVVDAPLARIWHYVMAGLVLILLLGGIGVMYVMHLNYVPIRNLEQDMLDAHALPQQSGDAVENMRQVFTSLKENEELTKKGQLALTRDQTVLKLINGHWSDVNSFNADAEKCGLELHGPRWFLVQIRMQEDFTDENRLSSLTACAKAALAPNFMDSLYLELPETGTVLFIVSTDEIGTAPIDDLVERLAKNGFRVSVTGTPSTHHLQRLHDLWSELHANNMEQEDVPHRQEEILALFQNALEFQERDRAEFALRTLCTLMDRSTTHTHVYLIWKTIDMITRHLTKQQKVRKLTQLQPAFDRWFTSGLRGSGEDVSIAGDILQLLFTQADAKEESTDQQMIRYLENHIQDQTFTVQSLADAFGLSLSNASHYFKTHIGISISEYMENLRMEEARRLLLHTKDAIAVVADKTGYTSSTFLRVFKKTFGLSPSEYRKKECTI